MLVLPLEEAGQTPTQFHPSAVHHLLDQLVLHLCMGGVWQLLVLIATQGGNFSTYTGNKRLRRPLMMAIECCRKLPL
jgi:hypothetical protein